VPDLPFGVRVLILLALFGAVAAVDYALHGKNATRWREYSFLLACAIAGGVFGAIFDQLSVTLSPDYFEWAKGIEPGVRFRLDVTLLGFQAGFFAGAVASGILMFAGRGLPLRTLARSIPWVPALALLCAPLGLLVVKWSAPELLPIRSGARTGFGQVMGLHYGLYTGALIGIVIAATRARSRRANPDEPAS